MPEKSLIAVVLLGCWVLSVLCTRTDAYGPLNHACCVKYTRKPVAFNVIKGYIEQSSREVCRIDAIIFLTKRNKKVCATVADEWVRRALMRLSDKMKKMSKPQSKDVTTVSISNVSDQDAATRS